MKDWKQLTAYIGYIFFNSNPWTWVSQGLVQDCTWMSTGNSWLLWIITVLISLLLVCRKKHY